MLAAGLPGLRGRHGQPRSATKAQLDTTTRVDCTARLSQVRGLVLVVPGRSTNVAPIALARQMHALISQFRLVLLNGAILRRC
jgi:hypothetical protein